MPDLRGMLFAVILATAITRWVVARRKWHSRTLPGHSPTKLPAEPRSSQELRQYLAITLSEFDDPARVTWDKVGLLEDRVLERGALLSRQGIAAADELSASGAITIADRDRARATFAPYLKPTDRVDPVPRQLPELNIATLGDPRAERAADRWRDVVQECQTLRRLAIKAFADMQWLINWLSW